MKTSGKQDLLTAFDRLFDRASSKLDLECSEEDRDEARQTFVDRFDYTLQALDQIGLPTISESAMQGMEESIDQLSPAYVAGYLATGPLVLHVQKLIRALATEAAEQKLLEQLIDCADDTYGGN